MSAGPRRGVTRGYVGALILAAVITAAALLIAAWGLLALGLNRDPVVSSGVPFWGAPGIIAVSLAILAGALWQQSLVLLRGRVAPAWGRILSVALGAYLLWCFGGTLIGLSIEETWTSPFAVVIFATWALVSVGYWAVLARRVYTDKPPPQWPWERSESGD